MVNNNENNENYSNVSTNLKNNSTKPNIVKNNKGKPNKYVKKDNKKKYENNNQNLNNNSLNNLNLGNNLSYGEDIENINNNNISHLVKKNNSITKNIVGSPNVQVLKTNNINEETKKFIESVSNKIKETKKGYDNIKEKWDDTSVIAKILNLTIPIIVTYYFTYVKYNLFVSIAFFIISFFILFMFNKLYAFMYLVLYIIIILQITGNNNKSYGTPISQTDLSKTKTPLDCTQSSSKLNISYTSFLQEVQPGYSTYSVWFYIDGSRWSTYRYDDWKCMMYRGSAATISEEKKTYNIVTQYPGFWLSPALNNFVIVFQNNDSNAERIQIDNVEMNKWINVITVIENKSISIYINGLLDRINNIELTPVDVSNYNFFINPQTKDGTTGFGFPGYITDTIYYNYPLTIDNIKQSYEYYSKKINDYQIKADNKANNYSLSSLITNSDVLSNN